MNTDNWREEFRKEWANQSDDKHWKKVAAEIEWFIESTLKEKDKEIASLRAELEGLKEQIPGLLKEQREVCADNAKVKRTDMMGDARCYTDKDSILSAPSPQIKQP